MNGVCFIFYFSKMINDFHLYLLDTVTTNKCFVTNSVFRVGWAVQQRAEIKIVSKQPDTHQKQQNNLLEWDANPFFHRIHIISNCPESWTIQTRNSSARATIIMLQLFESITVIFRNRRQNEHANQLLFYLYTCTTLLSSLTMYNTPVQCKHRLTRILTMKIENVNK